MDIKCRNAMLAALEVLHEACGKDEGVYKAIGDGLIVYVPKEFLEEYERITGHKLGNPITDSDIKKRAIEACKHAPWARHLAEKMVGYDAPQEVKEMVAEKLCRELID